MASIPSAANSGSSKRPLAATEEVPPNTRPRLSEQDYMASVASSSASSTRHVLVRVDSGMYKPFSPVGVDVMSLNESELLEAIAGSKLFSEHMKGMALDLCSVTAVASHERKQPLKEEAAHALPLEGIDTVADAVGSAPGNVFLHVTAPQAAGTSGSQELANAQQSYAGRGATEAAGTAPSKRPITKRFTVNGAVLPTAKEHYFMLPPDLAALEAHVKQGTFFMLHGPRGAGKTTTAIHLLDHLVNTYGWHDLVVDFNNITTGKTAADFWRGLSIVLVGKAKERGIALAPFDNGEGFTTAFLSSALGGKRVVLMLDEFDTLDHAAPGIKEEFLGAVRTIKQNLKDYAIQSMLAVGPFSILFLDNTSGSPFNVQEAVQVKFFTREQVSQLLTQFSQASGVTLEAGIAADIHEYTAGHAGLVCACGRALESVPELRVRGLVTLSAWQDFRARRMVEEAIGWPTVRRMSNAIKSMPAQARRLLDRSLMTDGPTFVLNLEASDDSIRASALYLAAEGWLLPLEGPARSVFRITSPLVHYVALDAVSRMRTRPITAPLPLAGGRLNMPALVAAALPFFNGDAMALAATLATKVGQASSQITHGAGAVRVPNEAAYHFQLFPLLRQWLDLFNHASVYAEADVRAADRRQFADLLIVGRSDTEPPKHIVELVASTTEHAVQEHYARTITYMAAHDTDCGTCIIFTAVASAARTVVDHCLLAWPSPEQLTKGLVAIHVVHDLAWTACSVSSQQAGEAVSSKQVDLKRR